MCLRMSQLVARDIVPDLSEIYENIVRPFRGIRSEYRIPTEAYEERSCGNCRERIRDSVNSRLE